MRIGHIPESLLEYILTPLGVVPAPLLDTFQAVMRARAIMVATKLGVFEALRDGPGTAMEVARRLNTDSRATAKLLTSIVGAGYLRFSAGRYGLTRASRKWLLRDSPLSLHDNMLHRFLEWDVVESFEDFVRTGKHLDVHQRLSPEQWETYQRGMRSLAGLSAAEVTRRLPVPPAARTMLDVGGGHGYYSVAVCRRYPELRSTILDLPAAIHVARPLLEKERMGDRIVFRDESVLDADLGTGQWDLIFLSQLVHHFDQGTNVTLMERFARSLRPGGVVAVIEVMRPNSPSSAGETGALLDLFFAVTSLSGCWAREEIADWQRRAGLVPRKAIQLLSIPGASIQAAVKAR